MATVASSFAQFSVPRVMVVPVFAVTADVLGRGMKMPNVSCNTLAGAPGLCIAVGS